MAAFTTCEISGEWVTGGWISLSFLAMLVVMMFLSITYMLSVLLKQQKWLIWAKEEFYQIIISAVIILFIIWFTEVACTASFSLADQDPFRAADTYLNDLIWQRCVSLATSIYFNALFCQIEAVWFMPTGGNIRAGFHPLAGMNAVAGVLDMLFGVVSTIFASLLMQVIMLSFIQSFAFKVMLPLGIFFRIFPFLRQAGATFIGLAIAFYIVFPLCYVMSMDVMEHVTGRQINFANTAGQSAFSNDSNFGLLDAVNPTDKFQAVANLIPPAIFLPMLAILISIACARSITKVLSQSFPSPFE